MGINAAYDMYNECCDGLLDPSWKVEKDRMSFCIFRQTLGQQMLEYDPRKRSYPGDDQLRVCTQQHKKRRASLKSSSADKYVDDGLSKANAWTPPTQALIGRNKMRIRALCEDIDKEEIRAGNNDLEDEEDEDERD
eukprot:scaffold366_cov153-Skeletonema_menzelii.AAC.20